jgi:hypothetical protein
MAQDAGNLRANMYIFKVLHANDATAGRVVLDEEGAVGEYNRANRSN